MVETRPPSGFRDFLNQDALIRSDLMERISRVYRSFGFQPLETPALENLDVLLGSGGGEENEKLVFKVMKRGEKLQSAIGSNPSEDQLADFGLRFDLTVPLSRCAAEYRGQIHLPWKVFHIGPVWRAERAQKGRFREFIQCDVDIVGAKTIGAELEVIQAVVAAIHSLGAGGFELRLNDRRLLQGLGNQLGLSESEFQTFAVLLDKKDKLEPNELIAEMKSALGSKYSQVIESVIKEEISLEDFGQYAAEATADLKILMETLRSQNLPLQSIVFDPSLVRGLGYYTGAVFELRHSSAGYSFGGGGRYDKLIGRFSKEALPACGFSIGFERLFLMIREQQQAQSAFRSGVFIPVFSEVLRSDVLKVAALLRAEGITADVYPDAAKLAKQFKYASDQNYLWALILGEDELKSGNFKLKDLSKGIEESVKKSDLVNRLK